MAEVTRAMPAQGRVLLRLFAVQAAWNYERMQGIGFGYASEPALRELEGGAGGESYRAALARESQFFNAHPYFAGLAVGAALRAEFEHEPPERIARLREALCGPLGSVGDRLFWASWLPVCSAAGLVLVAVGAGLWSVAAFLVLYNAAHLACRVWGLRAGWQRGMQVAAALASPWLRAASRLASPLAGAVVGVALPIAMGWQMANASGRVSLGAGLSAIGVAMLLRLLRGKVSGVAVAAALLGFTFVLGKLW